MRRFFISLCLALPLVAFTSCGDAAKRKREVNTARVLGRAQAMELSASVPLDTIEMEKLLIDVRSREAELRRRGHSEVADVYIASFLATLDSVNPSLAAELR